jgi:hypothetical protein
MGKLYQNVDRYLDSFTSNELIVEIGSDRWEGSSAYFAQLAKDNNTKLYTCDLDPECESRLRRHIPVELHNYYTFYNEDGTHFAERVNDWCTHSSIKVLYLDNYDWDWDVNEDSSMIAQQRTWYALKGIEMNNLDCQVQHLHQMLYLMPYMSDRAVVCVDDTYEYNGVFIGKGGAVVPYLLAIGYTILEKEDNGVILGCDNT